jgi:hypothetical protein
MAQNKPTTPPRFKRGPVLTNEQETYLKDYNELIDESDLVCVLATAAYLEGALITMLNNFFVKCDTKDSVFDSILSDLSKCAALARCLGFINGNMRFNLSTIGDIRNLFAHKRERLTFDHELVRPHCLQLKLPKSKIDTGHEDAKELETNPSLRFRTVSWDLLWWLATLADDIAENPAAKIIPHNFEHVW